MPGFPFLRDVIVFSFFGFKRRKPVLNRKPMFDALEDRTVPATLTVNTTAYDRAADSVLTLREAALIVNAGSLDGAINGIGHALSAGELAQINLTEPLGTNDTILFANSLNGQTIAMAIPEGTRFGVSDIDVVRDVRISGELGTVTLDAAGDENIVVGFARHFYVAPGKRLELDNLTLSGGTATGFAGSTGGGGAAGLGGSIYNDAGLLYVTNCLFIDNVATGGAGSVGSAPINGVPDANGGGGGAGSSGYASAAGTGIGGNGGGKSFASTGGAGGITNSPGTAGGYGQGGGGGGGGSSGLPGLSGGKGSFGGGGGAGGVGGDAGAVGGNGGSSLFGGGGGGAGAGGYIVAGFPGAPGQNGAGGFGGGDGGILSNLLSIGGGGAGMGGAIFNCQGEVYISNSTFTANAAVGGASPIPGVAGAGHAMGGAIFNYNGLLNVRGATIFGNTTVDVGGGATGVGIYNHADGIIAAAEASIYNTITDFFGDAVNGGFNSAVGSHNIFPTFTTGFDGSGSQTDSKLNALADNGGKTRTMMPKAGSPAINQGFSSLATGNTDQRGDGFSRFEGAVDIGAFEVQPLPLVVDTLVDEDDGNTVAGDLSLREAVRLASTNTGVDVIQFSPTLNGGTITLLQGQIAIASSLSILGGTSGITISGNGAQRIFLIDDGNGTAQQAVSILNLNLTLGNGDGATDRGEGGAIFNRENLVVSGCAFFANTSPSYGGAIRNHDLGSLTATNCTFSGNSTGASGGAIYNSRALIVHLSTITGNTATDGGGGIATYAGFGSSTTTLDNCIVAGNFQGGVTPSDLGEKNVEAASRNNLIGDANSRGGLTHGVSGNRVGNAGVGTINIATVLVTNLTNNGGPTKSHALVAGSPAINAGLNSLIPPSFSTDQRGAGFPRKIGTVDIGAYEFATTSLTVASGVLTVNDLVTRADAMTIRKSGSNLVLSDPTALIGNSAGTLSADGHVVTVPLAGLKKLVLNTLGGNDRAIFDFAAGGFFSLGSGIYFNAGTGADTVVAIGNSNHVLTNSLLTVAGSSKVTLKSVEIAILRGGSSNNKLDARAFKGTAVLDGGIGNDTLIGSQGRGILIGGKGADVITGGARDDIMIGGELKLDILSANFSPVIDKWLSALPYGTRVAQLRVGSGLPAGMKFNSRTVPNDSAIDKVFGGGGLDWFWGYLPNDILKDRLATESLR